MKFDWLNGINDWNQTGLIAALFIQCSLQQIKLNFNLIQNSALNQMNLVDLAALNVLLISGLSIRMHSLHFTSFQ